MIRSWWKYYQNNEPSSYMIRQLKLFKKNPQSFQGHIRKLINICTLKHNRKFIRKYKDYLDWDIISSRQKLTQSTIEEFTDYVNWEQIFHNQTLSTNFIRKYINKLNDNSWKAICAFQELDEQFLRDFKDKVDWGIICINQKHIKEEFFEEEEIKGCYKMSQITQRELSLPWLERHANEFDEQSWNNICCFDDLSEKFMDKHSDKLNWMTTSGNQKFSIKFAEKYKDKIVWEDIGYYVFLSPKFIEHFKDRLNWPMLSMRQLWTDETIHQFLDYIVPNYLVSNSRPLVDVSESCLREFFMQIKPPNFLSMDKHFSKDFTLEVWDGK